MKLSRLKEVKELLESKYLAFPNVTGIDVGYKIKNGKQTKRIVIRFFVNKKKDNKNLDKQQILPKKILGIATDVVERSYQLLDFSTRKWSPNTAPYTEREEVLRGGLQIATGRGEQGTLGMIVKDNVSGKPAILTNRHVLEGAGLGGSVFHPAQKDQYDAEVAKLTRIAPSDLNGSYIDAAIAVINEGVKIENTIKGIGVINGINSIDEPAEQIEFSVSKSGRTTILTHGFVTGLWGTLLVDGQKFKDSFNIRPDEEFHGIFSSSGDSGSVIVDDHNRVVGLLYAGTSNGHAIFISIEKVFAALDISLLTPEEIDAWNNQTITPPEPPDPVPPVTNDTDVTLVEVIENTNFTEFQQFIEQLNLRHFKAYELWQKGDYHSNPDSHAFGLNTDPPKEKWRNIIPTIRALDELRERLGAPIIINSVYRSEAYNRAIGGVRRSQHIQFCAIDFMVRNTQSPSDWATVLKGIRQEGIFKGGIGVYQTFVHVDSRGHNMNW